MTLRSLLTLALLCGIGLAACHSSVTLPQQALLECPPPDNPCQPASYVPSAPPGDGLEVVQVEGLNGPSDEFGIAFPSSGVRGVILTRRTAGSDTLLLANLVSIASARVESPISTGDLGGSTGTASLGTGGRIIYTAKYRETVKGDYDLFLADYRSGSLSRNERIPISARVSWDGQPALSPDGRTLFFVSDRKGSRGGTDIYVTRRSDNGSWSDPVSLGASVNSACDELSPFVSSDGRWLYFSSSGHETLGGYDIFRAPLVGAEVGRAENLGMLVNTPADELFPSAPAGVNLDTLLYFSSNRTGAHRFDIHVMRRTRKGGVVATDERADSVRLVGTVRDGQGNPVDSALVTVEGGDPPQTDSTRTDNQGRFTFVIREGKVYVVTAGSEGMLYDSRSIFVPPSNTRPEVTRDLVLPDTVTFRINFPFNNATDPYEFTLDDNGMPTAERWTTMMDRIAIFLRRFAEGGTKETVGIVGHTDPFGSDAFNIDLGRRRAEFVRRELVKRGVPQKLLSIQSEGESKPLPMRPNEPDETYRARLRRVELVRK